MLPGHGQHLAHVLGEAQLPQGLFHVLRRDRLLRLLLRDVVGLRRHHGHELDAAVDQQVARVLAEGEAAGATGASAASGPAVAVATAAEDLGDDLLDGGFGEGEVVGCCVRGQEG